MTLDTFNVVLSLFMKKIRRFIICLRILLLPKGPHQMQIHLKREL